jgi:glucose/arabinose dehydrogenase
VIRTDGSVDPKPWANVNRIFGIRWTRFYHGGLSGIAFDPDYVKNHFVYVVTQTPSKRNGLPDTSLILRFKEVAGRGTSPKVLYRIRAKVFDNVYSLVFGPDGMLYIPSGFLGTSRPKGEDPLTDRRGKILESHETRHRGRQPVRLRRVPRLGERANAYDLAFFPARTTRSPGSGPRPTTRSTSSSPAGHG